jgi:uncharacterized protein YdiU (UPF0061 family)
MHHSLHTLTFDNRYARLTDDFYTRVPPTPLPDPYLISYSPAAADLLELDPDVFDRPDTLHILTGNQTLPGMQPLAMLYAGHQFGHYVPQLGDGRALLLGETRTNDRHWAWHLKGAGMTAYSRHADGRAVLRSSVREYLASEAMAGLGIPTTRALSLVGSPQPVHREQPETAATVLRLAPSFIRFGSFEIFYYQQQPQHLKTLADHVIQHHYPTLAHQTQPYLALLRHTIQRTADLIAAWQLVGFAHGVLNTDNMSILGLTLDYGPYGFLDQYDPNHICNHTDQTGRYAFSAQPDIGLWNLYCLAQALLPLLDTEPNTATEQAQAALQTYQPRLQRYYAEGMQHKLGLTTHHTDDPTLITDLLTLLHTQQADYTAFFRRLSHLTSAQMQDTDTPVHRLCREPEACSAWLHRYQQRLQAEHSNDTDRQTRMQQHNPKYILRNYLAQEAIDAAEQGDFSLINRLLHVLTNPYTEHPAEDTLADLPPAWAKEIVVSCSS